MNPRLLAIEVKRARLIERAAREREYVADAVQAFSRPLAFIDRCLSVVRYVAARPALVLGGVLVLALLRPRRAFKWARRALGLWQGYRWLTRRPVA